MDLLSALPAFVLAVVIISITPGPAVALIVRRTALRGRWYGLATIIGLEIGLYIWALLVASGVAVVAASELGFLILKTVGCLVLAWLAFRSFRAWWRERKAPTDLAPEPAAESQPIHPRAVLMAVGEGIVVQLANPKAAVFLLALYPQFVPPDRPLFQTTALLGLLQVAIETLIYGALALAVSRAGQWLRKSVIRRRLEAITGTVLIGLGVRLAVSDR